MVELSRVPEFDRTFTGTFSEVRSSIEAALHANGFRQIKVEDIHDLIGHYTPNSVRFRPEAGASQPFVFLSAFHPQEPKPPRGIDDWITPPCQMTLRVERPHQVEVHAFHRLRHIAALTFQDHLTEEQQQYVDYAVGRYFAIIRNL